MILPTALLFLDMWQQLVKTHHKPRAFGCRPFFGKVCISSQISGAYLVWSLVVVEFLRILGFLDYDPGKIVLLANSKRRIEMMYGRYINALCLIAVIR